MVEVFLYRCMNCSIVACFNRDRGPKFYVDQCVACKEWSDHERVYVSQGLNMYKESYFLVGEGLSSDTKGEG